MGITEGRDRARSVSKICSPAARRCLTISLMRTVFQTSAAFDSGLRQLAWFMISSRFFERFIGDFQVIVLAVVATGSLPNGSQTQSVGRVIAEQIPVTDIAAHRGRRAVTGLIHDGPFGFPSGRGRGGEAGAQAVPGKVLHIVTQPTHVPLHHHPHRFARQPPVENLAVPGVALPACRGVTTTVGSAGVFYATGQREQERD